MTAHIGRIPKGSSIWTPISSMPSSRKEMIPACKDIITQRPCLHPLHRPHATCRHVYRRIGMGVCVLFKAAPVGSSREQHQGEHLRLAQTSTRKLATARRAGTPATVLGSVMCA